MKKCNYPLERRVRSWRAEDGDGKQPWPTVGRIPRARRRKDARKWVSGPRDDGAEINAGRHRWEFSCRVTPAHESTAWVHEQKGFNPAADATFGRREPGGGADNGGRFISRALEMC